MSVVVVPRDSSDGGGGSGSVHRNLSTPKKPVAGSGSSFVASDSFMDSQGATRLNDATIVQPLSVSGLFTRPPTANNVRFLYFLIFVCMYV